MRVGTQYIYGFQNQSLFAGMMCKNIHINADCSYMLKGNGKF